jgi:hypothetical protein
MIKPVVLEASGWRLEVVRRLDTANFSIVDSASGIVYSRDVRFDQADSDRLNDWIVQLDESNYPGACDVTFVTLDLGIELTFSDVDDEAVTATIFLLINHDDATCSRSYRGVRCRVLRSKLIEFSDRLLQVF